MNSLVANKFHEISCYFPWFIFLLCTLEYWKLAHSRGKIIHGKYVRHKEKVKNLIQEAEFSDKCH